MKKGMFGVISIAIVLIGVISLAEAILRIFDLAPTGGIVTVTKSEFDRVPGLFKPAQRVLDTSKPALEHTITINNLGFRDAENIPLAKGEEFRVLFVGDSFVLGDFVNDDETMPAQLQDEARRVCAEIRVINAGIGGTTIRDHIRVLERSMVLEPDLVVLGFTENDVRDLIGQGAWEVFEENREAKSKFPMSLVYPLVRNTALWNLSRRVRAIWVSNRNLRELPEGTGGASLPDDAVNELRRRYEMDFAEFRRMVESRGVPLFFVASPAHTTLMGTGSRSQLDWVGAVAESSEVEYLDLSTALLAGGLPIEELFLLPHDGHPSAIGHRLAAQAILHEFNQKGTLRCR